jgi:arsenite methyltransferase
MNDLATLDNVKRYYGQTLTGTADLKTSACCSSEALPPHVSAVLDQIEPEVLERFYGCGSPLPEALEGLTILDLGCGSGRDVFLAAKLVGPSGRVIGLDMTEEQLAVARRNLSSQMRRFGFERPNVRFVHGYIEDLQGAGIETASIDLAISNCAINLSPDKARVFAEIHRVLKPGGELYFADVLSDRRVPEPLRNDPILHGECLGGALYREDFRRIMERVGFLDPRTVHSRRLRLGDPQIELRAGMIGFYSDTVRAFKLDNLEDRCEDYGQVAIYLGSLPRRPHAFRLDDHHLFPTGKAVAVCGNTAAMLQETRFGAHFRIVGDRRAHYGAFPCGAPEATPAEPAEGIPAACC